MRAAATVLVVVLSFSNPAFAQTGVGVELDEVVDNRLSEGPFQGSLEVRIKLKGTGLDKAAGARVVVKDSRDDRGNALGDAGVPPDFTPSDYNSGMLQLRLRQPARAATSVRVKGVVELFVPGRDPNAVVNIANALGKLDAPLSSKVLKSEKLTITPLSRTAYAAAMKARKLDEKAIAEIRAEGRKQGVPEKEIELALELAKAMGSMDAETPPEGAVILSGKKSDFDRIFRVEILGTDGKPLDMGMRTTSTRGEDAVMTLQPPAAPPANATLQLYVLTTKSRLSFPFDMEVPLP